ncbi:hypothetical protein GGR56DRAFT_185418 [Xylariaceae sp. FL0804]|nr:hypothetical protein GGR56DRAFT_185418 [Xylariaceae sp. FL0804]
MVRMSSIVLLIPILFESLFIERFRLPLSHVKTQKSIFASLIDACILTCIPANLWGVGVRCRSLFTESGYQSIYLFRTRTSTSLPVLVGSHLLLICYTTLPQFSETGTRLRFTLHTITSN